MSTEEINNTVSTDYSATHSPVIKPAQPLHRHSFPICPKCNQSCLKSDGKFVRALNQVYHYQCFVCEDCSLPVAEKYYSIEESSNRRRRKIILCKYHYMKRSDSICPKCDRPCSGQRFHPDCIQCPHCPTSSNNSTGNNRSSFYEYNGQSYCRIHYSLIRDTHCSGCNQAILKQFVQHRDMPEKIWHPECYMIYKFWSVKLDPLHEPDNNELIEFQAAMEKVVNRVWTDLSSFEESAANCISDLLLNVAAGSYNETIRIARQFIMHLEVLFNAIDFIEMHLVKHQQSINCLKEANLICVQVIQFLQLLNVPKKSDTSITQDLLSLVTGLAQSLKSLIRIGLTNALRLEREFNVNHAILDFLQHLLELEKKRVWIAGRYWFKDPPSLEKLPQIILCGKCNLGISDEYYSCKDKNVQWHPYCFTCSACSSDLKLADQIALDPSNALLCQACRHSNSSIFPCTRVSLLHQHLQSLKLHVSRMSSYPVIDKKLTASPIEDKEHSMAFSLKRQKPVFSLIETKAEQEHQRNKPSAIHLGQVQSALVDGNGETDKPNQRGSVVGSVRRAFSISSGKSVTRKFSQRQETNPIYNLFRRYSKRGNQARRASVFTIDDTGHPSSSRLIQMSTLTPSQDYVLRHVAVITIQPLLTPYFTVDGLADILEHEYKTLSPSNSNQQHHHHSPSALWGKLITHIKTKHVEQANGIFGVSLSTLVNKDKERHIVEEKTQGTSSVQAVALHDCSVSLMAGFSENALIPTFVKSLVSAILQSDMSVEGVFRKNGNIRQLKLLAESVDKLYDEVSPERSIDETMNSLLANQSPIQLAALLKRYLRELPEPLLTFQFYKLFIHCGKMKDSKRLLHIACCLLPKPNRDTMLMIFCCLKWISGFSDTNKMDVCNLARVIAPSVLYGKPRHNSNGSSTTASSRHDSAALTEEITVIEHLIRYGEELSVVSFGTRYYKRQRINELNRYHLT
ncbi:hypothetical protein RMATCC62417_07586 [Rhizopus microsporus]|nr:hypothetical protein RMATCC62417_07586 [Rhizopus microsporus]